MKGGTIVTPAGRFVADVVSENGIITQLVDPGSATAAADEVVEAHGRLVFPGFIDPHVHSRDPGLTEKEDFAHSTRAAAAGGVTTICEMPNAIPPVSDLSTFRDRAAQHSASAFVDFGLWALAIGIDNLDQVPVLIDAGVVGVKLFWGYALNKRTKQLVYNLSDEPAENLILPPTNGEVFELFAAVAKAGGLLAAHCEDRGLIEAGQRSLGHEIQTYSDFLIARPEVAEATSIAVAAEFSRATGCRFHVVHMSSARGAGIVAEAQRRGVPISGETCPQYLSFTADDYEEVGPVIKVYPPIRHSADREALWDAVLDRTITSVSSDHAPHTVAEKRRGLSSQPAGCIGVETLVPVMLDHVARGRLSPEQLAWACSEGTARLYGLFPRKGAIRPGSDADMTIVDPDATWRIVDPALHSKNNVSPWNGRTGRGRPVVGILRGEVIMREGEPQGKASGRLVRPIRAGEPSVSR